MNKKIFTLLATSLMLLLTANVVNAQPWFGPQVDYLPKGLGKGAYHLKVTHFGQVTDASTLLNGYVVALDSLGFLKLVTEDSFKDSGKYRELREALWCVNIKDDEILGKWPTFNFVNKEYETLLAVDSGRWIGNDYYYANFPTKWGSTSGSEPTTPNYPHIFSQLTGSSTPFATADCRVHLNYQFANWRFSETYNTTPIQHDQPFLIEIPDEPGYYLTFATRLNYGWATGTPGAGTPNIELVKVHRRDLDTDSHFYIYSLLRFEIVSAAPRVLNAADFNSKFGTQSETGTTTTLKFNKPTAGAGVTNVLDQGLRAYDVSGTSAKGQYMTLRVGTSTSGAMVYVADGDNAANYYSDRGIYYPILRTTTTSSLYSNGRNNNFRMVYYPSEDSLILNVRAFNHIEYGSQWDGKAHGYTAYGPGNGGAGTYDIDMPYGIVDPVNSFSNQDILWYLTIRMQDLVTAENKRVITVADYPTNTLISFGIKECKLSNDRTTVPRNLYLIRDALGRYLTMPLELGDFTPQWLFPLNDEDPMKTPSYQWLVIPDNETADVSAVKLVNREFDWVHIESSTIYSTNHYFNGYVNGIVGIGGATPYNNIFGTTGGALIYYSGSKKTADPMMYDPANLPNHTNNKTWDISDGWHGSFLVVQDDRVSYAKNNATPKVPLTQDEMQKLYRTSAYLGYKFIKEDTLNYFTYSFKHLHKYSTNRYLGPKPKQIGDTILYGIEGPNYFELQLTDGRASRGTEHYGIGWPGSEIDGTALRAHPATADIAPLQRYYYHFKENNYWDFTYNDNFVILGENRRYGFTDIENGNTSPLEKSAFYIRFTYQPPGMPEYYSLLERIPKSSMGAWVDKTKVNIAQELKVWDDSHGGLTYTDTLGIAVLHIDENTAYARTSSKVTRDLVSVFAVSHDYEPLYRRFNEGVYPIVGDQHIDDGGISGNDDPRLVKIYRSYNEPKVDYLIEDANGVNARDYYGNSKKINYLSLESIFNRDEDRKGNDKPWLKEPYHNYAFYLDTAFVNRGTGHIKPQYMLVLGPKVFNEHGCLICGEQQPLRKGIYGRYLINATDSARGLSKGISWAVTNKYQVHDADYIWDTSWDRLVFVPAIHIGDSLYILRGGLNYESLHTYGGGGIFKTDEAGVEYLHLATLKAEAAKSGSLIDIRALNDNFHKDWVFSMRFYEQGDFEHFLLESETTNRVNTGAGAGRMIAPMTGGWVKSHNFEMVISRGSYKDAIKDSEKFNTEPTTDKAVANDPIAAGAVKVFAGEGSVTILNAAGKRVTISNILGQTVAGSVLTSDNATIAAPKGVLVVAVEGESAVKAVVK